MTGLGFLIVCVMVQLVFCWVGVMSSSQKWIGVFFLMLRDGLHVHASWAFSLSLGPRASFRFLFLSFLFSSRFILLFWLFPRLLGLASFMSFFFLSHRWIADLRFLWLLHASL
jgi:hypothetical protein